MHHMIIVVKAKQIVSLPMVRSEKKEKLYVLHKWIVNLKPVVEGSD